eukprot:746671-Hanusia_phi.AAC.1
MRELSQQSDEVCLGREDAYRQHNRIENNRVSHQCATGPHAGLCRGSLNNLGPVLSRSTMKCSIRLVVLRSQPASCSLRTLATLHTSVRYAMSHPPGRISSTSPYTYRTNLWYNRVSYRVTTLYRSAA